MVCKEYGIKVWESSEEFLITYYRWAAEVMKVADPAVMSAFERRLQTASGTGASLPTAIEHYYGAAFEYLLMGATFLRRR